MAGRTKVASVDKAVGYLRVSTEEQTLGPEAQRAALERWCAANKVELVEVFTDQGVSGGAALDKRPALLAAVAALKQHGAGVLLVAKRDRLARDTMLAAMVERLVEREGATVRTADATSDGNEPEAVLMRRIVDAFAEYERLLIKARTRAALAVKRSRGERTGDIPYGFQLAADGVHLEPLPTEQAVVASVRDARVAGMSLRGIREHLAAEGFTPRSGGRWHIQTIANILKGRLAADA